MILSPGTTPNKADLSAGGLLRLLVSVLVVASAAGKAISGPFDTAGDGVVMSGFRTRSVESDDSSGWELSGNEAVIRGKFVSLCGFELTIRIPGRETLRVTSPQCNFDRTRKIGTSGESLCVESESMKLKGTGYDLLLDQQKLKLRSNVRMRIRAPRGVIESADRPEALAEETEKGGR